jgi:hypothetical protein
VKEFQIKNIKIALRREVRGVGKKKKNSYKMLSVMDHTGRFTFVRLALGSNDREMLTSSPLYLQEGEYFAEGKFIAADGGFEGDGRFKCSHMNPGNDPVKIIFNLTWREVRTGVENKYQRVGAWFPLLGNNKRNLMYSEKMLLLAIHAAVRLHNFILSTENLSYAAYESPEMEYNAYF